MTKTERTEERRNRFNGELCYVNKEEAKNMMNYSCRSSSNTRRQRTWQRCLSIGIQCENI